MINLTSLDELKAARHAIENLKKDYPSLFVKFLDMVNLTRAFHFKYQYMGDLMMDENPGEDAPKFVYGSVLRLYKRELQKLKDDADFEALKQIFKEHTSTGYTKICLLTLGMEPESLTGTSYFK